MAMWMEFFLVKTPQKGTQRPSKVNFVLYLKQISGRNSDSEWLRMTDAFILWKKQWKSWDMFQ